MSRDTTPAPAWSVTRVLAAVAITVGVFVVDDQLASWLIPPVPLPTFLVAMAVVAVVVLTATRGRVALPRPTEPWPSTPLIEPAARSAAWFVVVVIPAGIAHLLVGLWWPDVVDEDRRVWAPLYQSVVRAPLWEELVWRGVVLGLLLRLIPARTAIVISAVAFALIHYEQGYRGPGLVDTFAVGIATGVIAWHTGRVWLAVATHAAINADLFGVLAVEAVLLVWLVHHVRTDRRGLEQRMAAIDASFRRHLRRR